MSISASKQTLQIGKRNHSNFVKNSVISIRIEIILRSNAPSTPFYRPNVLHVDFCVETIPANQKTQSFKFRRNSVISIRIEIILRLNAPFTPFYTPNLFHVDFSVAKIPAKRKTQSFKFRRKRCYFNPDCDILAFYRSFHSILQAKHSARQFRRRYNPCKSQNAILQITTGTLLIHSRMRYLGVLTLFSLHSTRRT
jgi:hypothetical protein